MHCDVGSEANFYMCGQCLELSLHAQWACRDLEDIRHHVMFT